MQSAASEKMSHDMFLDLEMCLGSSQGIAAPQVLLSFTQLPLPLWTWGMALDYRDYSTWSQTIAKQRNSKAASLVRLQRHTAAYTP